jgi:hypothetical protein
MPLVPVVMGLPVLLPPHDDFDMFGDGGQHYHIDYRYCADDPIQHKVIFADVKHTWEERELVRKEYQIDMNSFVVFFLLTQAYQGEKLNCGKCPHKGFSVTNGQCPGHGLTFDENGEVDTELFIQLVNEPESRKLISIDQMRQWVRAKYGWMKFEFGYNDPICGKYIRGVETVNRHGRILARVIFKFPCVLPKEGGSVDVTFN